ncbi:MoxR domain-containing protein [Pseudomonas sp. FH4]|jgi:MoxR-like ATPase|uniref:MoxR family ATPase n=1 Tax=Pseudomonas brenneri TaxID=129817 RepID=A0A5B2V3N4_9PSED|nr:MULTISPECIES: MoxR family ATPase [Pseudomonas]KAA6175496.1 MoxR family ATPase [Pseudomonas marginalis]ETK17887.1 MoxR domain-containing protein [Pseudomonas sp. FH4]KAA2233468.1 MoxR family ATPase [Pseudomonas brenneri]MBF8003396.1 MoxR family ATPase [Pseudomonas brenneri]TWR82298.1 MoxR family ATPase [Pseudomonas brenneri]
MTALNDLNALQANIAESVLGQDQVIRQILLGLLANGHLLLESLPGLAKTRTVKALARHLDAKMSRIQFTPDLLPSDITGAEVLHQVDGQNQIRFQPGPLFGNLILADEINRAPAKVQAALLEAMEERQITVAGASHALPELFIVVATQNPIEQEGTYPLPEAQMDRFVMKILLDYPSADDESQVLRLLRAEEQAVDSSVTQGFTLAQEVIFAARKEVSAVQVSPAIDRYLIDLINATRHPGDYDADLARWISLGASPRGGIGLDRCARADAWLQGQAFVTPANVQAVVHPVLRHRLQLSYDAVADGVNADQVLDRLLAKVALPA